ncbi:Hypothetical protein POVR2_LOCUS348 [uncultured virus]|nr:Hypothetical protein POVR2_LOCUS348 [uncultured virus]
MRCSQSFNLPPWANWDEQQNANWQQVHNILSETRHCNPFVYHLGSNVIDVNKWNTLAVRILAEWNYQIDQGSCMDRATRHGDLDVVRFLLAEQESVFRVTENEQLSPTELASSVFITAANVGKLDHMRMVLTEQWHNVTDPEYILEYSLQYPKMIGNKAVVEFLEGCLAEQKKS